MILGIDNGIKAQHYESPIGKERTMIDIKISVHPVSHRLEWRGWGGVTFRLPCEPPTTNALTV